MRAWLALALMLVLRPAAAADYVALPGGSFTSVLPADGKVAPAQVAPFRMRTELVTNGDFLAFVKAHPEWQRDKVASILADARYLTQWESAGSLGSAHARQPVTRVSWFAAQAYCESEQARLPGWYEWEFAAAADATRRDARKDAAWREDILG
ncbi:MAG: SUMF1/EgtB/PvdO family nonheme iron enzyme, partial [Rhodanobacter sp.]